jgi:ribonuclease VapC
MTAVVIDASAVIALIKDEPGAAVVAPYCAGAIISSVNIQEIYKVLLLSGLSLDIARDIINDLELTVKDHSEVDAFNAASLVPLTSSTGRGIGDRSCMALAISEGLPALTTDRAWSQLTIPGLQVILAR